MENLELRMYGLVPYNISPIQQAIQFGHAVVEYGQKMKYLGEGQESLKQQYNKWADEWKTFIILNGGTSNHSVNRYNRGEGFIGSMEESLSLLEQNDIKVSTFYEPDLNDMLSAIVFIVDERVFDRKLYPDFNDWVLDYISELTGENLPYSTTMSKINQAREQQTPEYIDLYNKWSNMVGGSKNIFLRDFLKNFRMA